MLSLNMAKVDMQNHKGILDHQSIPLAGWEHFVMESRTQDVMK